MQNEVDDLKSWFLNLSFSEQKEAIDSSLGAAYLFNEEHDSNHIDSIDLEVRKPDRKKIIRACRTAEIPVSVFDICWEGKEKIHDLIKDGKEFFINEDIVQNPIQNPSDRKCVKMQSNNLKGFYRYCETFTFSLWKVSRDYKGSILIDDFATVMPYKGGYRVNTPRYYYSFGLIYLEILKNMFEFLKEENKEKNKEKKVVSLPSYNKEVIKRFSSIMCLFDDSMSIRENVTGYINNIFNGEWLDTESNKRNRFMAKIKNE